MNKKGNIINFLIFIQIGLYILSTIFVGEAKILRIILSFSLIVSVFLIRKDNKSTYYNFVLLGMIFCFLGDLTMADYISGGMLLGMGIFALGHINYSIAFIKTTKENGNKIFTKYFFITLILYYICIFIAWFIFVYPSTNSKVLIYGALVYGCWVSTMATFSFVLYKSNRKYLLTAIGCCSFVISDFTIGLTSIGGVQIPFKSDIIWLTYVFALFSIIYIYKVKNKSEV